MEYLGGITGLLVDLALLGGIILFIMSFFNRFRQHKKKLIITGVVLVIIGAVFTDFASLQEAYERGLEAGRNT